MSIKLRKEVFFLLSFLFAFALYWYSMDGKPIWDDFHYWFTDPVMTGDISYWTIWSRFGWPFSVSIQKLMLKVLERDYFWYHLTNFFIHCCNSLLVYKLGRFLRFKNPLVFFLLFLLHPVAVISTAWMVQIKTLLCFFFALASLLCFLKGEKSKKWMLLSWLFFALSITSKSASVTVPVIFLFIHLKHSRFKKIWVLIPFFLLSGWNTYRVLRSPITIEGKAKAEVITQVKDVPSEPLEASVKAPVEIPKIEQPRIEPVKKVIKVDEPKKILAKKATRQIKKTKIVKTKSQDAPKIKDVPKPILEVKTDPAHLPKPVISEPQISKDAGIKLPDFGLILQTLHYYFWQSLIPVNNVPVRGLNFQKVGAEQFLHLFFLLTLIVILWKDSALLYLAAGHFLLLPFLGIIKAPFMNVTWVSDQHLYLILPCFLAFWMRLIDKINWKYAVLIPATFSIWFSWETYRAVPTYKNQFIFYRKSLEYNPLNVPIAYNLAFARLLHSDIQGALLVIDTTLALAQTNPVMTKSYFYFYLFDLKQRIQP